MIVHAAMALAVVSVSLAIGVCGYRYLGGLGWVDSLLNASMILGGMGPVDILQSRKAKLFAAFYALFSGIVFLGVAGIMLAPIAHRVLHYLHLEESDRFQQERERDELSSKH
jgi:hypothetical protein